MSVTTTTLVSLPREIHAVLASCLGEGPAGDLMRTLAGPAQDWVTATDLYGLTQTRCNGLLNSFRDQPAEIWSDGSRRWYKNGLQHRDGDQPAVVRANGSQFWYGPSRSDTSYKNGLAHRDGDQPAEIWSNGSRFWYKDGLAHRDGDQPAEIWEDGTQSWYKNGKQIRKP